LDEYFDHPVTGHLFALISKRLSVAEDSREAAFIRGNPYLTAENNAYLSGAIAELSVLVDALNEEDLELLVWEEEEDDSE
jgi:hypothetical protein